jgi:rhamnulokinase
LGVEVQQAVLTDRALELNVTNEGGIDGTYRLLKNIMGLWLVQECRRAFERRGKNYDYAQLTALAAETRPLRSLVNPDDRAFLKPDDMAAAIRDWCGRYGEPVPQTEGELVRCALESLAFKYRMVVEWLEELTGIRIETIHIVGGGCQNESLNQLTADACGRPVVAGPVEATVLGNLLVQARTAGELGTLADLREIVGASSSLTSFEPRDSARWNEAYPRFVELVAKSARDAAI